MELTTIIPILIGIVCASLILVGVWYLNRKRLVKEAIVERDAIIKKLIEHEGKLPLEQETKMRNELDAIDRFLKKANKV